jgi:anti-sigma regulatory factor (Ser/Thr protein kinase)
MLNRRTAERGADAPIASANSVIPARTGKIRQLTDVSHCNLQQHFCGNRLNPSLRNLMDTMTATRPAITHRYRVALPAGPAAAAQARGQVRAAILSWDVPVDTGTAILLTSEVVTNAITHAPGDTVLLAISCRRGQLRVDVHDASRSLPVPVNAPADAEAGRGLLLVNSLSDEWGTYRTPSGKAVYFALDFQPA